MSFRIVNGSSKTENGWRCCNRDECGLVAIKDLFLTDTAPLRKGPPLIILGAWLYWYDRNVEEITSPVWGWSLNNDVLGAWGANMGSNHLSATAVDINAPKYPWGTYRMPADKIAKVEEGLRLFGGSVFWGRRWSKPDEMHFQMAWPEGDARNDAFAQKLLDGYLGIYKSTPAPPTVPPAPPTPAAAAVDVLARSAGITVTKAREILPTLSAGLRLADATNPQRVAMDVAQWGHESDGFATTVEYADGSAYEGRVNLGNTQPGDGRRFKGRGWIQCTGRHNYGQFSRWAFERDLVDSPTYFVDNPERLADLRWAGTVAAWYTVAARPAINGLADRDDVREVTRLINGGYTHLDQRIARYQRAIALGDDLMQLLTTGDDMANVPQDEWNESLDLQRQMAKYRRPSLSPLRWPREGDVNTCAGFAWTADALSHVSASIDLATQYGHAPTIAMLMAVAQTDEPNRDDDKRLAQRILQRVPAADKAYAEQQIKKWLDAERKAS